MPENVIPPVEPGAAWHAGLDAELVGHGQNKGWNMTDPKLAFLDAAKAYRGAEQHVGVPPEQVLRLTKNADGTLVAGAEVWEKLGAPKEAKDYTFEGVDLGTPEKTAALQEAMRKVAAELRIPKSMAETLVRNMHEFNTKLGTDAAAAKAVEIAAEKDKLRDGWKDDAGNVKAGWGPNQEANTFVAKTAAAALGVTNAEIDALEGVVGYARVMELFRSIGARMGEDKFITAPNGSNKPMTKEAAIARYSELFGAAPGMMAQAGRGDTAWQKRYQEGGRSSPEFKELQSLLTIMG